jgi:hypothetical protein
MTIKHYSANITLTSIFWGIVGGISLIVATRLTTNGPLQCSPYPFILIAAILTIALSEKSKITLRRLFIAGFNTFMIMSIMLYLFIIGIINPNSSIDLGGHLWRIVFMIAAGIFSSFLISIITRQILK